MVLGISGNVYKGSLWPREDDFPQFHYRQWRGAGSCRTAQPTYATFVPQHLAACLVCTLPPAVTGCRSVRSTNSQLAVGNPCKGYFWQWSEQTGIPSGKAIEGPLEVLGSKVHSGTPCSELARPVTPSALPLAHAPSEMKATIAELWSPLPTILNRNLADEQDRIATDSPYSSLFSHISLCRPIKNSSPNKVKQYHREL